MTARVGSTFSTLDSKCILFYRFSFGLALSPTKQQQHHKLKVSVTSSAQQPHVMTSPRSTGQNPWQLSPSCDGDVLGAVTSADVKTVSFSGIMRDETRQKESLQKLTNKPLHLIQVSHNLKKNPSKSKLLVATVYDVWMWFTYISWRYPYDNAMWLQIEEKAIQELLAHYTEKETVSNARISVERRTRTLAAPLWEGKQAMRKWPDVIVYF